MELQTKKKFHIILWCEIGALALVLLVALAVLLCSPKPQQEAPTEPTQETLLPPNPYGPEDFGYLGEYLTCIPDDSVLGIDVSTFQKNVDWQQVKAAGVEFVIIRLGHRGTNIGVLFEDEDAQSHYEGAIAAGLQVGGYFYSQAITPEEAREEAEMCLQIVEGWTVEMPIVFDWEHIDEDCRTVNIDPRTLTDCAKAFCQTVEKAGYDSMIYFNQRQTLEEPLDGWPVDDRYYLDELLEYGFWLAMYESDMTFPTRIDMWQYTSTGRVPGIGGNVDINLYFPEVRKNK